MWLEKKEQHNKKHDIQAKELAIGSILLLWCEKDIYQKLAFKWLGLYQIYNAVKEKKTYMLEELDGLHLAGTFASDRLKKFYSRKRLQLDHIFHLDHEKIPTLNEFLAGDSDSKLFDTPNNYF